MPPNPLRTTSPHSSLHSPPTGRSWSARYTRDEVAEGSRGRKARGTQPPSTRRCSHLSDTISAHVGPAPFLDPLLIAFSPTPHLRDLQLTPFNQHAALSIPHIAEFVHAHSASDGPPHSKPAPVLAPVELSESSARERKAKQDQGQRVKAATAATAEAEHKRKEKERRDWEEHEREERASHEKEREDEGTGEEAWREKWAARVLRRRLTRSPPSPPSPTLTAPQLPTAPTPLPPTLARHKTPTPAKSNQLQARKPVTGSMGV
ncbi:hypothetical protein BC826DRAFT_481477 [Russula brevipes]|nr:hypothetical protein BC826DRAFT_481477 [Russula brevipes]